MADLRTAFRGFAESIFRILRQNQYVQATVAFPLAQFVSRWLQQSARQILVLIKERVFSTIHLSEHHAVFVQEWLRQQSEMRKLPERSLVVRNTKLIGRSESSIVRPEVRYEYDPVLRSCTRLWRMGKPIWFELHGDWTKTGAPHLKNMWVTFWGRDTKLLESIVSEGQKLVQQRSEKYVTVYTLKKYNNGLGWSKPYNDEQNPQNPRERRIDSVILPPTRDGYDNGAKEILDDCKDFLRNEEFYNELGTPHRRGYLLHGVPGSGKSSLVMAIATELAIPVYWLQLSTEGLSDETLIQQLQAIRDRPCCLLYEDIDRSHTAALEEGQRKGPAEHERAISVRASQLDDAGRGMLTTSGLLNALDGPGAPTGILLFLTTNKKDKLDPALIRSGRIDVHVEFKYVDNEQVKRLVRRFYYEHYFRPKLEEGAIEKEQVDQILSCIAYGIISLGEGLTAGDINGYLLKHKGLPYQAWKNIANLKAKKTLKNAVDPKAKL